MGNRAEENHNCQNELEPARKRSRPESEEAADEDEGEGEGVCVVCLGVLQHLSDAGQAVQVTHTHTHFFFKNGERTIKK